MNRPIVLTRLNALSVPGAPKSPNPIIQTKRFNANADTSPYSNEARGSVHLISESPAEMRPFLLSSLDVIYPPSDIVERFECVEKLAARVACGEPLFFPTQNAHEPKYIGTHNLALDTRLQIGPQLIKPLFRPQNPVLPLSPSAYSFLFFKEQPA